MVGRSRSSQWAKALQSPVREYIKVIFVVSQELVYQRGDCFIFAEVCVHIGVSESCSPACRACVCACVHVCAFAWMCLCVLVPTDPSRLTTELSGSAFHFKCSGSHSRSLAGPRGSLANPNKSALHCFLSVCMHVCMYNWRGVVVGGGVEWTSLPCTTPVRGK